MSIDSDLIAVAQRVVWFEEPRDALTDEVHFLCQLMQNGTDTDVRITYRHFSKDDFRHALDKAPAGILDHRSWTYWNLMLNSDPTRPMPQRFENDSSGL